MMGVVPGWKIIELVNQEEVAALRNKLREDVIRDGRHVALEGPDDERVG